MGAQDEYVQAHSAASSGVGAQTLLEVLDPLIEERLGRLLTALEQAKPELPVLLDLRAKITEVNRIRRELLRVRNEGVEAATALRAIAA